MRTLRLLASAALVGAGVLIGVWSPALAERRAPSAGAGAWPSGAHCLQDVGPNNLRVGSQLGLGAVTIGATTLVQLMRVGHQVCVVIREAPINGLSTRALLAGLLPHGLIEVIGFILAGAAGLIGPLLAWQIATDQYGAARCSVRRFVVEFSQAIGMILLASGLECHLTPAVMSALAG